MQIFANLFKKACFSFIGHPLTYGECFEVWVSAIGKDKFSAVKQCITNSYNITNPDAPELLNITKLVCANLKSRWKNCSRSRSYLFKKESGFLASKIFVPENLIKSTNVSPTSSTRGRPQKKFEECSDKTKKRRVETLVKSFGSAELQFASSIAGPSTSTGPPEVKKSLTLQQALSLYLDLDLSERKYTLLRTVVNSVHADTFPSLYRLNMFKQHLYPEISSASETAVEVNIPNMLYKTVNSICSLINAIDMHSINSLNLTLVCKWGMDGSSGHSTYKQIFSEESATDEFMFFIGFVPIMLIEKSTKAIVWKNPRSSSSLYCRPFKFVFCKENEKLVTQEYNKFENYFKHNIETISMRIGEREFTVDFEFHLTMIDGSVCNIVTETKSTASCYICGAKPSQMNKTDVTHFVPDSEKYKYGLSTLHCWIRFLECCLHIAYRLPFKKWRASGEFKELKEQTKRRIQSEFKKQLGLNIDKPKQGYGSSNDGNTARTFFEQYIISAKITGLNEILLYKFYLILRILNCKERINVNKFNNLAMETRDLYLQEYSWYNMPMSIHKILVHGYEVISQFNIPIGEMSEECLEARHKEIRKARLTHTRKRSRTESNIDLMNRLIITSDPLLAFHRKILSKKGKSVADDSSLKEYFMLTDEKEPLTAYNIAVPLEGSDDSESDSGAE